MKKILLFLVLLLLGANGMHGKIIPVTDIAHIQENLRSWLSKVLKEECKDQQMEHIKRQLIENLERYTETSKVIRHSPYIINVLQSQRMTYARINQFYNLDNVADPELFNQYKSKIQQLANRLQNNIDYSSKLRTASMKMDDGERLEQYDKLEKELKEINSNLDTYFTYYTALNNRIHILRQVLK